MIREIEKAHWEEALELVKRVFMEFEAPEYPEEGVADFMKTMGDESYLNMHRFFGYYINEQLVGVIAERNNFHHLALLFVDKDHHRQGIGKALIQHLLDQKDQEPMTVCASPYGHEFYKKQGFVDTDEEQITNGVRYIPMIRKDRFKFNTIGLFTTNNRAIVDFYTQVFGFKTDWDGIQPNVEMTLGQMRIILFPRDAFEQMVSHHFDYPKGKNGTMELSFDVPTYADVDKEYQHAITLGATSVLVPTTEPWGQRTCYVADPEGNLIEIGSFQE